MTTELKTDKTLEAKLAEPFLDGITLVTNELRTLLAEAKTHADGLKAYIELAKLLQREQQESASIRQQLEQQADYPQLKAEVPALRAEQTAFSEIFPACVLVIFGIHDRKLLTQLENRKLLPAIFAWLTFEEWSEKGDAQNFVSAFRKVDAAVWEVLQGDNRLDGVRFNIAEALRNVIDRNLRADFAVEWGFSGQGYEESKHHSESGGTVITAVKSALITRDANVLNKALVDCN